MKKFFVGVVLLVLILIAMSGPAAAQLNMPDPRAISGIPREAADLPAGAVSVRLVRGSLDKNLPGLDIEFTIDGRKKVVRTDDSGRAQVNGLKPGARVKAVAVVDGERLETQDITMATAGVRVLLAATDPDAVKRADEDRKLAAGPAVKGSVVFGPESRVVLEFSDDAINVFYVIEILNTARMPVDIGGPVVINLPREARGATVSQDATKTAAVAGTRLTVTGPFAPGTTVVQMGFELPSDGATAVLDQVWPAPLEQVNVLVQQVGAVDIRSPQIASKRVVSNAGQPVIVGNGPAIPAGGTLHLEISGLAHHSRWPRYTAVGLSAAIMALGIWAAATPRSRQRSR